MSFDQKVWELWSKWTKLRNLMSLSDFLVDIKPNLKNCEHHTNQPDVRAQHTPAFCIHLYKVKYKHSSLLTQRGCEHRLQQHTINQAQLLLQCNAMSSSNTLLWPITHMQTWAPDRWRCYRNTLFLLFTCQLLWWKINVAFVLTFQNCKFLWGLYTSEEFGYW